MDITDQASRTGVGIERITERGDRSSPKLARLSMPNSGPADSVDPKPPVHSSSNGKDEDWRTSLESVMGMLQDMVAMNGSGSLSSGRNGSSAAPNHASECALALARMRLALDTEFDRLDLIEQALRTDLSRTRSELVSVRETARKAIQESMHDSLTGLPNRACFRSRLDRALTLARIRKQIVGVLFVDLESFRSVNDAYGHLVGDACLKILASRMARTVRTDDTVSRYGGDEFACLINNTDHDLLSRCAGELHTAISEPVSVGNLVLTLQSSIGISTCSGKGPSATEMMCRADRAMYHARKLGLGFSFHGSSSSS